MKEFADPDVMDDSASTDNFEEIEKQERGFLGFFVEPERAKAVIEQYAAQGWKVVKINVYDSAESIGQYADYYVVMEKDI